jgi:hypothetical protein
VLSRRGLFKGLLGVAAAPALAKVLPPPATGLAAWLPTTESQFFGVDRNAPPITLTPYNDYLKTLWPPERVEQLAYEDSPLLALCPTDHS